MEKGRKSGWMVVFMRGVGNMDFNKVREHFMEVMGEYILGPGKIINFMGKVNSRGQMVKNISVNTKKM